jgi:hypothetical protein
VLRNLCVEQNADGEQEEKGRRRTEFFQAFGREKKLLKICKYPCAATRFWGLSGTAGVGAEER